MKTISQKNCAKICGGGMYGPGFDDMYAYKPLPPAPPSNQPGVTPQPPQVAPQPPAQGGGGSVSGQKGRK